MTTPFLAQVNIFLNHPTKTKLCPRENGHRASILLTEEAGLRALQFRFEPRVLPRCRALAVSGTAEDLRGGGRCRFSREHSTVGAGEKIPWQGGDCWSGDLNPSTTSQPSALRSPSATLTTTHWTTNFAATYRHWPYLAFPPSVPSSGLFIPLSHLFPVRTRTLRPLPSALVLPVFLRPRNLDAVVGPRTNLQPSLNAHQRRSPFHTWNCGCCFPFSHSRIPPHSGHKGASILSPASITNRQTLPPTMETAAATATPCFISLQQSSSFAKPTRFHHRP